jgi:hypothetical protein
LCTTYATNSGKHCLSVCLLYASFISPTIWHISVKFGICRRFAHKDTGRI